jgi:hypothetical protein
MVCQDVVVVRVPPIRKSEANEVKTDEETSVIAKVAIASTETTATKAAVIPATDKSVSSTSPAKSVTAASPTSAPVCQTYLWPHRQRSGCKNATEEIVQLHKTTYFLRVERYKALGMPDHGELNVFDLS